jgi:hypothetical protein
MPTSRSNKPFLLAAALLAAASVSQAEPVQVKPGVWAFAVTTTINGRPLPMPALGDGPAAQEWRRMQQLVKQFGLPEGGHPGLACQRESAIDVRQLIAKDELASKCKIDLLEQRRDGGRFSLNCQSADGVAQGKGEATVINGTEARVSATSHAVMHGQALDMETRTVSKWVGPDCQHPPAGIDPSWIQSD